MKRNLAVLFSLIFLFACSSRNELASAKVDLGEGEINLNLYSEDFMNGDGLIRRIVSVENPSKENIEFTLHTAHYSDIVFLKLLQTQGEVLLLAEDKTGYTVWDMKNNKIVSQINPDEMVMVVNPEGTARDYMTRHPFTSEEWGKLLKLGSGKDMKITEVNW